MSQNPNAKALTCLITEPILDPRKKKQKRKQDDGTWTASTEDASGGFSSVASHRGGHGGDGSLMTLSWFSKIKLSPEYQKHLSYPESCLIINDQGEGIGKMYTSVEISTWAGRPCILVNSGSYAKIGPDVDVGTTLTGFLSPDLKVIQELCHEWCNFHQVKFDRKTFLMEESSGSSLYCRTTFKQDDLVQDDHVTSIPFIDLKSCVSESANILLQRLIIFEKRTGTITLKAINSKGTIPVDYRVLGRGVEKVKGEKVEVFGIRRSLWGGHIGKAGQAWDSVFNFYGRLVLRCQPEGNNHAMIPLWFRPVEEYDDVGKFMGMLPPIIWACDQELYSNYLMKKTELAAQYKTYLMDHPPLRSLLGDFMQKLLFTKPNDVFQFANEYFAPLLKLKEESSDSSDCETSSSCSGSEGGEEGHDKVPGTDEEIMKSIIELHQKMYPLVDEDGYGGDENGVPLPPVPSSTPAQLESEGEEEYEMEFFPKNEGID